MARNRKKAKSKATLKVTVDEQTVVNKSDVSATSPARKNQLAIKSVSLQTRRNLIKAAAALVVAGGGATAVLAYDRNNRELHDLEAIGSGHPVVVQIHDPSCPICRRLKSRSLAALNDLDHVRYRLADVTTSKGRALQTQYGVDTITLLLFDERGRLVQTVVGLQTLESLEHLFNGAFR